MSQSVFDNTEIDGVINMAAETHVDRSILDPQVFLKTNIIGTHTLLEQAKEQWCHKGAWKAGKKFLQVSTDEVYGSLGPTGISQKKPPSTHIVPTQRARHPPICSEGLPRYLWNARQHHTMFE